MIRFMQRSECREVKIDLPPSKSISNRVLIMDFVREGRVVEREGMSESEDTKLLSGILRGMTQKGQTDFNVGNNGAICRFLIPLLATMEGRFRIDGDGRMRQRPINELVEALNGLGGCIEYEDDDMRLPIKIEGNTAIVEREVVVDGGRSSQFASALMMVAPRLTNGLAIRLKGDVVSKPYLEMTIELMQRFGVEVSFDGEYIQIEEGQTYKNADDYRVEKDWSSASYWYLILALLPIGSSVILSGLTMESLQGDRVIADIARSWGVDSEETTEGVRIEKTSNGTDYLELDCGGFPDLVPTIAVGCCALNVRATLSGVEVLRFKESDRLNSLICELDKVNGGLTYVEGRLCINPDFRVKERRFDGYNDHRLVMAFSALAIRMGDVFLENTSVIDKSYPRFFEEIEKIGLLNRVF